MGSPRGIFADGNVQYRNNCDDNLYFSVRSVMHKHLTKMGEVWRERGLDTEVFNIVLALSHGIEADRRREKQIKENALGPRVYIQTIYKLNIRRFFFLYFPINYAWLLANRIGFTPKGLVRQGRKIICIVNKHCQNALHKCS